MKRENRMDTPPLTRERGLWKTVHADLLALRVRAVSARLSQPAFPGNPSDWLQFPRLQLRGSAGFSPASLLVKNEVARTEDLEKNATTDFENLLVERWQVNDESCRLFFGQQIDDNFAIPLLRRFDS